MYSRSTTLSFGAGLAAASNAFVETLGFTRTAAS